MYYIKIKGRFRSRARVERVVECGLGRRAWPLTIPPVNRNVILGVPLL